MRKIILPFITFILFSSVIFSLNAQNIPSVQIKNLENKIINTQDLFDGETLVILSFWATWCKPCIKELEQIQFDLSVI